ncbi:Sodium/hydrogen exchanger [Collybia nuda]|uniref:Sodium/hydrogen exchanger n=1 Tax=Collybia nuda TaxID=64659 RepID=A0A9P6CFW7_9AGAR|nr:Sodium/hydrogen exchanger [Collybia nuda]
MSPSLSSTFMNYFPLNDILPRAATEQGGVISGDNPSKYNPDDPYKLWVIQVVLILVTSRICYLGFYKMRQPRVVAEIFGGIILGPTIMGRIPGFSNTIFPEESLPILNICSTIGLAFFLFFAGLEVDVRLMNRNMRASIAVSVAGLVVPFAFGFILALALYREYIDPSINFGHFGLFTAIGVGITAFPILCRMLVELGLFDTNLGVVVITAGLGNDVVGWILLALAIALVNARNGITILYMVLACIGYALVFLYPVRWAFRWIARKTGSLDNGTPSPLMLTSTLALVLASSFFTDIIGLHPIFGAFMAGLIVPHDNGLSIAIMKQLEGIVMNIFLPIYFTLSGLKTDLGLLNNGKAWGYTILVCIMAFSGKFIGCAAAAKYMGFNVRESGAIGTLMTCKGLLELIVVNLGLQAGILSPIVFAMFVFHALLLTFITTPITALIMPEKYRLRLLDSASSSQTTLGVIDPGIIDALDGEEKARGLNLTKPTDPEPPLEKSREETRDNRVSSEGPTHSEERDQIPRPAEMSNV